MFYFLSNICIILLFFCYTIRYTFSQECLKQLLLENNTSEASNESTLVINFMNTKAVDNHLPKKDCAIIYYTVVKRINPYKDCINHLEPKKRFNSVCLQCAACLAIARQINKVVKGSEYGSTDPNFEMNQLETTLRGSCNNTFNKFDLRGVNGFNFVMKASQFTIHVPSDMDGKWPLKLEEMCHRYVDQINLLKFYAKLIDNNSFRMENFLCRGDGVFRNCYNVNYRTVPVDVQKIHKRKGVFC